MATTPSVTSAPSSAGVAPLSATVVDQMEQEIRALMQQFPTDLTRFDAYPEEISKHILTQMQAVLDSWPQLNDAEKAHAVTNVHRLAMDLVTRVLDLTAGWAGHMPLSHADNVHTRLELVRTQLASIDPAHVEREQAQELISTARSVEDAIEETQGAEHKFLAWFTLVFLFPFLVLLLVGAGLVDLVNQLRGAPSSYAKNEILEIGFELGISDQDTSADLRRHAADLEAEVDRRFGAAESPESATLVRAEKSRDARTAALAPRSAPGVSLRPSPRRA